LSLTEAIGDRILCRK